MVSGFDEVLIVSTISQDGLSVKDFPGSELYNSYLPGRGDTMIKKVVHPGRGSAIALRLSDLCEFPKCGNLDCIICGSGGLRSRSPLISGSKGNHSCRQLFAHRGTPQSKGFCCRVTRFSHTFSGGRLTRTYISTNIVILARSR